ncbi:DUF6701 domain-containing protein [Massilia sp. TS11]|uniref:DUF6701 domain-containing protein n=1 Tax=Massilia sp. TS11 TaxID=2908003 RepID=UPI001EDC4ED3|nr:DUF6701 domain-containing protein [Massilia sp. TS11]MCG2584554.1 hypothetical protein [Massilia sp. TS11]
MSEFLSRCRAWLFLCLLSCAPAWAATPQYGGASSTTVSGSITFVGAGTAVSGTGNVSPTLPAYSAGDFLFCMVESHDNNTHTMPAGWTQIYSRTRTAHRASAFYRIAQAGDTTPTVTHPSGDSIIARCFAFRGVDQTTPLDISYAASAGVDSASSTNISTGSLAATVASNPMILMAGHIANNPGSFSVTTTGGLGWTQAGFSTTATGSDAALVLYYTQKTSNSAISGPLVMTGNNQAGENTGVLLALRPGTSGGSFSVTKPSGTLQKELLLATVAVSGTATVTPTTTCGSGWNQIANSPVTQSSGTPSKLFTFYCVTGASEPASYSFSVSGTHAGLVAQIADIWRIDPTNPIDQSAGATVATGTSNTTPSVTTTATNALIFSVHAVANSVTWTPPTGSTEGVDIASLAVSNDSGISMETAYVTLATPGSVSKTATAAGTATSDTGTAAIIAIRPASNVCTSVANGNWTTAATWDHTNNACNSEVSGGGYPTAGDVVVINGHAVTLDATSSTIASLTINGAGTLTGAASVTLNLGGNLTNNNTANNSINLAGTLTLGANSTWSGAGGSWTLGTLAVGNYALSFTSGNTYTLNFSTVATPITLGTGSINANAANSTVVFAFSRAANVQTIPTANITYPSLTVSGGSTKTPNTGTLNIRGALTVGSGTTFAANTNNPTVNLYGNFSNAGSFNSGSGTWSLLGSSSQSISGTPSFQRLTVNNSAGVQLSGNVTVSTLLTLTNGIVTTNANTLIVSASCLSGISRTSGYVAGYLRLTWPASASATSCIYPVGSAGYYDPIGLSLLSTAGGTLTGWTTAGDHPQIAGSGLSSTANVNRYWSLWNTGDAITVSSYGITLSFNTAEVDSGAVPTNFIIANYKSAAWTQPGTVSASATSTSASGISAGFTSQNDFAAGPSSGGGTTTCTVPAGFASCYCDDFVSSANWSYTKGTGATYTPSLVGGKLRLTDNTTTQAGAAHLNRLFPASGNKIVVEFDYYSYNGTGGDGLGVILSDASYQPVAGAYGGSLGFAQKTAPSDCGNCNGFAGGWLGVGIDEFGNFSNPTEGRSGGSGQVANSVAVRGSGNGLVGYDFHTGTGSLSPNIAVTGATAGPGHRYRVTVDHTDSVHAYVTVDRDTTPTHTGYTNVIGTYDAKAKSGQAAVPTYWYLSYAASTGGSTNIHEIASLKVCTAQPIQQPTLNHVRILNDGSGLTCQPKTITLKACADAACSTLYLGSTTVNLSTTGGTWSSNPVTFSGGQGTVTLTNTSATSVTIGGTVTSPVITPSAAICYNGATAGACTINFSSNACSFDVVETGKGPGTPIYTKVAGKSFTLDVLGLNAGVLNTGSTASVQVQLVNGTASGTCGTTAITPLSGAINLASGRRTFTFTVYDAYQDVRAKVVSGATTACSSDNFAIRPSTFTLSSTTATDTNPLGTNGVTPVVAGNTFDIKATSRDSTNAYTTAGYAGTPLLNANFVSPYSGSVQAGVLSGSFPTAASGVSTASYTYSETGTFDIKNYGVYDDGSWANVDRLKATAECFSDGFLGTNHDLLYDPNTINANGMYGCFFGSVNPTGGTTATTFGRFIPAKFVVGDQTIANRKGVAGCSASEFNYMGESATLGFSLTAVNANGGVTKNYNGSYARFTLGGFNAAAVTGTGTNQLGLVGSATGLTGASAAARITVANPTASSSWANGVASFSMDLSLARASNADGPYNPFNFSIAPKDADGVKTVFDTDTDSTAGNDHTLIGSTAYYYGRMFVDSPYGSEKLAMPVTVQTQYWDGSNSKYVTNADDDCTPLTNSMFTFTNVSGGSATTSVQQSTAVNNGTTVGQSNQLVVGAPTPTPTARQAIKMSSSYAPLPGYGILGYGVYQRNPRSKIFIREVY